MLTLSGLTKKKLKILLCSIGVIVAMSLVATMPSVGHDSINHGSGQGKVSALKPSAGKFDPADQQGGVRLSSSASGSSAAGDYSLQGTTPPSTQTAPADNNGNSSSPVSTPPASQPDVLYPIDPTPKCAYYWKTGVKQPYACPVCEGATTTEGIRYPCGCGSGGIEMMCVDPLSD